MKLYKQPKKEDWQEILKRPTEDFSVIEERVVPILKAVSQNGDQALRDFAKKFDNLNLQNIAVPQVEIDSAEDALSEELKAAMQLAYDNVYKFHLAQKVEPEIIETMPGVKCWRKSIGIQKVGIYIPGGTAPLFSSVLMMGIPAKIAGCQEVVLCSPSKHPAILYAAKMVGIKQIFNIGGAQAIAAMAYGTASVPKVYKIYGPGNQYVTVAKQIINKEGVAIDMPAGPSEVAIFADDSANPSYVAADLLSQAEHGVDSQVLLISTSETIIQEVQIELASQLITLPRSEFAEKSLSNSKSILIDSIEEGIAILNEYAAEHLILALRNADEVADKIINAASIFIGNYSPESCGDYASGTNHTLPTNGFAKAYSGVSLDSFVKKVTYQKISKEGLQKIGPSVQIMAETESLQAHSNAIKIRLQD